MNKSVWIFYGDAGFDCLCSCSNCGAFSEFDMDKPPDICTKCGASMDGIRGQGDSKS